MKVHEGSVDGLVGEAQESYSMNRLAHSILTIFLAAFLGRFWVAVWCGGKL